MEVRQTKEAIRFAEDEHVPKEATQESLSKLPPVFKPDGGTATAGNSSGINDGVSMMLVTSAQKAEEPEHRAT
ncbi:MAG: acetyl-CoA C-acetyltransferase [Rubrobacteraceae bacterium]|nr:acetyl-CoA C-acetyltransferase [Rubrobacteraceae bacterium]